MLANYIIKVVEWFYFPFLRRYVPKETFRYGLCGGANMVLDMFIYFGIYNYILTQEDVRFMGFTISSEIASFLITMPITLFTGFWLAKYVSFKNTSKKTGIQSIKYLIVVVINIITKYLGLKLLVGVLNIYPSVSNALITIITVVISYCLQRKFTFK